MSSDVSLAEKLRRLAEHGERYARNNPETSQRKAASVAMGEKKGFVRCCDCIHRHEIVENRGSLGSNPRDKYCPVPANGQTLLNGMRSDQALRAWRKCPSFEWDHGKEVSK